MGYEYITKFSARSYYSGRPQGPPDTVVIHWWDDPAKKPQFQSVIDYLCKSTNSSAHYVVEAGRVACLVSPSDRAWHAGSRGNPRGIGIECNPRMSKADKETVAELIANLRKTYGNLTIRGHRDFMATSCPGTWYGQLEWLDRRARELSTAAQPAAPVKPAPAPVTPPKPAAASVESLARAVIRGEYGNGDDRRRRLGSRYAAVQKRVNEILGAKPAVPSVSTATIDSLARAVIRGEYGNGADRRRRLGTRYASVQKRVNEILGT